MATFPTNTSPRLSSDAGAGGLSVARLFHVRPEERRAASLLFGSAFAIIFSYLLLKSAYKSIFLAAHGPDRLPYIWMVTAAVGTLVGLVHARLSKRMGLVPLIAGLLFGLAATVLLFRLALYGGEADGALAFGLAVFGQLYGVLAMSLLWLAANHLLEARQARRILPLIATGAILGGIVGGETVGLVVRQVGTKNLLWGTLLFLSFAALALTAALRGRPKAARRVADASTEAGGTLRLITQRPYLRLLVGVITVTMLCSSLAEYQFQWAVKHFIEEGDAATAYFGKWLGRISLLSLAFQLGLTTPLLRRFGVGLGVLLLPVSVVMLSGGMLLAPGLILATILRVGDSSLRYSVNKSSVELLYLPLPAWLKDRTKVFIDTVLDRTAKGLAGILLLGLFALGLDVRGIALITCCLALSWVAMALLLRTHHVNAFRDALSEAQFDPAMPAGHHDDHLNDVVERLHSESPRVVGQSLDLLLTTTPSIALRDAEETLLQLAADAEPRLARRALKLLCLRPSADASRAARSRLHSGDPRLVSAVTDVLWAGWGQDAASFVSALEQEHESSTALAVGSVLAAGVDVPDARLEALLWDESEGGSIARCQLAKTLNRGQLARHRPLLRRLMADPSPAVAAVAIEGAGRLNDASLVPFLITALRRAGTRPHARRALAAMDASVLPSLGEHFQDPRLEYSVRREIPRTIAEFSDDEARRWLIAALATPEPGLRLEVMKALERASLASTEPTLAPDIQERALLRECEELTALLSIQHDAEADGPARRLFDTALAEARSASRERLLRLLALGGDAEDWENVASALASDDLRLRASAVEFADVQLPQHLRRMLIPLIEDLPPAEAVHMVTRHVNSRPDGDGTAWSWAAGCQDRWLSACALTAGAEAGCEVTIAIAARRVDDPDPLVRQAARVAAREVAVQGGGGGPC